MLCVLILLAVGAVLYFQVRTPDDGMRPKGNPEIVKQIEARHGAALRAVGVRSLGVDPRNSEDVVVVLAGGGHLGRKVAGRLPGLVSSAACGRLEVGISVGDSLTAWGSMDDPAFMSRLDCVVGKVVEQAAELRDPG
ncbi:MAG: hypothetical protein EKK49_08010 [Rhodocyclaceae bacterium]|nr:MAG: hypothetical protein EKK49_08010 [Rhodocyclaceae bacterium]